MQTSPLRIVAGTHRHTNSKQQHSRVTHNTSNRTGGRGDENGEHQQEHMSGDESLVGARRVAHLICVKGRVSRTAQRHTRVLPVPGPKQTVVFLTTDTARARGANGHCIDQLMLVLTTTSASR
jgi:hypothetical protein